VARAEWFTPGPGLPEAISAPCQGGGRDQHRDDLSPATHATTRPDIPLHAMAMLRPHARRLKLDPKQPQGQGPSLAYVGDVVRHRQLAQISDQLGALSTPYDIPHVANKRGGALDPGRKDRPDLFFNTARFPAPCRSNAMSRR